MRPDEKGFLGKIARKSSVEKVLPPLLVLMPDQAHELPRSVERKRPRTPGQFQAGFFRSPVALAIVAVVAAGYEVLPRRMSAARAGHNVIERQLRRRKRLTAKL